MEDNGEIKEGKYGFGSCNPRCLQFINNAKGYLILHILAGVFTGTVTGGLTSVNVNALERRFGLSSTESGVTFMGYDIGFLLISIVIACVAHDAHRPRWVGSGCALFGLGALLYTLPHFASPLYIVEPASNVSVSFTCDRNRSRVNCAELGGTDSANQYNSHIKYMLFFSQLLMGIGVGPLFILGIAYLEDSVSKHSAGIYIGLANSSLIFGPLVGFLVGGYALRIYVDFDSALDENVQIGATDPRWVGAWWITPLIAMALSFTLVIPLWGFPKYLPGTKQVRLERISETHTTENHTEPRVDKGLAQLKSFPHVLHVLVRNSAFCFVTLGGIFQMLVVNGSASFIIKLLTNQFHLKGGDAGILTGVSLVPAAFLANVVSGLILFKFKLRVPTIIRMCVGSVLMTAAISPYQLLYCDSRKLAGVTASYYNGTESNLTATCNAGCECQEELYRSTCGSDGLEYFSPCHAGCQNAIENGATTYTNCSCVSSSDNDEDATATISRCASTCSKLPYYLVLGFLSTFFNFSAATPLMVATMRMVPEGIRSSSLAIQWMFLRACGSIPAPLIFGAVMDQVCLLRQKSCTGNVGSCWVYDSRLMAIGTMGYVMACCSCAGICHALAAYLYTPPKNFLRDDVDEIANKRASLPGTINPAFKEEAMHREGSSISRL